MIHIVHEFIRVVGIFFAIYMFIYSTFLFLSVAAGAFRLYKRDRMSKIRNELRHDYYMPVSIIVPAYNEEVTIVDSVSSLLSLEYRLYEVIVVDDGSKDNTSNELIHAYNMSPFNRPIHLKLQCQQYKEIYEAQIGAIKLTLIRKVNGGKGDALNMGINASQYPYYVCIDADSMLQKDSLEKIVQPVLEDDGVVAVGGLIRVAQCAEIKDGIVENYNLPKNVIICMQVMEYDRSFMASRILMDLFNGNLIISGAFGLFKKATVIACGGYNTDTLGEDMDLVVKLHVFCRNNNIKYSIRYEPAAVCWSQAPTTLRDLAKQRRRWNLGLFQSLFAYRQIFGKLRFGLVSFISYMYYLIFELLSPFIEIFGMLTIVIASYFGLLNFRFMFQYFLLYTIYGTILTITAFYQRIYTQRFKITLLDLARAFLMCIIESAFFKYVLTFIRATSFFGYKKRRNAWGSIKRVKHTTKNVVHFKSFAPAKKGTYNVERIEVRRMLFGYSKKDMEKQIAIIEARHKEEVMQFENKIKNMETENASLKLKADEYDRAKQNIANTLLDLSAHTQQVNFENEERRKKRLEETEIESRRMIEKAEKHCRQVQDETNEKLRQATEELQSFKDNLAKLKRDGINVLTEFSKSIEQLQNSTDEA